MYPANRTRIGCRKALIYLREKTLLNEQRKAEKYNSAFSRK